jgi:hypothetical protein
MAGALTLGATGLIAAPAADTWLEQWYKAKYGRTSPMEEARLKAEAASTAFREDTSAEVPSLYTLFELQYKAKYGRPSPMEEARWKEEKGDTAFRAETAPEAPARSWFEQWHRVKFGRPSPTEGR